MKKSKTDILYSAMIIIILIAMITFVVLMAYAFIGMLIDHECYQMEPNDRYVHTVCERYWIQR